MNLIMEYVQQLEQERDQLAAQNEAMRKDALRWRWITRAGRTRGLMIPADENKASIDAAIDGQRLEQEELDAKESYAEKQAMYG